MGQGAKFRDRLLSADRIVYFKRSQRVRGY